MSSESVARARENAAINGVANAEFVEGDVARQLRPLLERVPPAPSVTHVMVWAEYGYGANLRLEDFASPSALFVTHRDGEPLSPDHGAPLRLVVPHLYAWKGPKWVRGVEYLEQDRRGFWEERGYHNRADPWQEQRYSYQERPGDGPEL